MADRHFRWTLGVALGMIVAALAGDACAQGPSPARDAGGLVLVEDGKPTATIVAFPDLSASEQFAVEELRTFVRRITGAGLPIVTPDKAPAGKSGTTIVIGNRTVAHRHPDIDLAGLGDEGFVIKTVGDQLVIAGGEKRGTLYGVYTFLESLGCRWWYPGESTIPTMKTIRVEATDRREVPRLEYRDVLYGEMWNDRGRLWAARNKLNGMAGDPAPEKLGGHYFIAGKHGHNSIDLVEESVDEMKPEFWAMVKDKRVKTEVCQSHPEVIAATIRSLAKLYKANPDTMCLIDSHEDNRDYCRCPTCAAIAEREGSPSGQWFHFVNAVAEGVEKEVPGARLMSSAYGWTQTPPRTIKPRGNVIVRFAPIGSDWAHPLALASNEHNRKTRDDITFWGRAASKLFIWTYIGNRAHYLMPNPDLDAVVPNIKFYADHNAVGIMEQGTHAGVGTEFVPLRLWIQGKALWNPDADGKKLLAEFVEGYYGRAAPAIRKYIDVMHRYGREHDYHLKRVMRMNAPFLQPAIIAEAEEALREADKLSAGDAVLERRVRHAHMPVWYVLAKRGPTSVTWKAPEKRVGKLDFARIAAGLNQVGTDYSITAVADPERAQPFFQWLTDYGKLVAERGVVLPPELRKSDLKTVRLMQARQIDSGWLGREGWWVRDEAASDGWALKVPTPRWLIQHHFSPHEECAGGKRFKLFIRVRGGEASGDGKAFVCGTRGDKLEVEAARLADGKYHVFEVGEFPVSDDMMMYIALSRPSTMTEVYLDCLWLTPVE